MISKRKNKEPDKKFEQLAELCAQGDIEAMMELAAWFRDRFSPEIEQLMEAYERNPEKGEEPYRQKLEHNFEAQAYMMWVVRAGIYGHEKAQKLLEKYPYFNRGGFIRRYFFEPWPKQNYSYDKNFYYPEGFYRLGIIDMPLGLPEGAISKLMRGGYYEYTYVSWYCPADETGFGMEEEYETIYFDQFFRLIPIKDKKELPEKLEQAQQKREKYWAAHPELISERRYNETAAANQLSRLQRLLDAGDRAEPAQWKAFWQEYPNLPYNIQGLLGYEMTSMGVFDDKDGNRRPDRKKAVVPFWRCGIAETDESVGIAFCIEKECFQGRKSGLYYHDNSMRFMMPRSRYSGNEEENQQLRQQIDHEAAQWKKMIPEIQRRSSGITKLWIFSKENYWNGHYWCCFYLGFELSEDAVKETVRLQRKECPQQYDDVPTAPLGGYVLVLPCGGEFHGFFTEDDCICLYRDHVRLS